MCDIVEVLKRFLDDGRGEAYPLIQLSKAEIERLRNLNETYKHDAQNQRDIVEQQRARIAELEEDIIQLVTCVSDDTKGRYHVFHEKQIDAALKVAHHHHASGFPVLEELGIVRCEECKGRGQVQVYTKDDDYDADGCERCNGHGWRKLTGAQKEFALRVEEDESESRW
jgi:hypothetical protein